VALSSAGISDQVAARSRDRKDANSRFKINVRRFVESRKPRARRIEATAATIDSIFRQLLQCMRAEKIPVANLRANVRYSAVKTAQKTCPAHLAGNAKKW
jgi:hypothetical protein